MGYKTSIRFTGSSCSNFADAILEEANDDAVEVEDDGVEKFDDGEVDDDEVDDDDDEVDDDEAGDDEAGDDENCGFCMDKGGQNGRGRISRLCCAGCGRALLVDGTEGKARACRGRGSFGDTEEVTPDVLIVSMSLRLAFGRAPCGCGRGHPVPGFLLLRIEFDRGIFESGKEEDDILESENGMGSSVKLFKVCFKKVYSASCSRSPDAS